MFNIYCIRNYKITQVRLGAIHKLRSPEFFENLGYFGASLSHQNSKNDKIRQSKFMSHTG